MICQDCKKQDFCKKYEKPKGNCFKPYDNCTEKEMKEEFTFEDIIKNKRKTW